MTLRQNIRTHLFFLRNQPFIIWRYILLDFLFSFIITLIFFIIIFIVNQLLLLTKDVLQIEIPFSEVLKLLFFALPNILSISIPFASLVACLMSVGHFSTHNEFVAMKANGISFSNIFVPYVVLAMCIMFFSLISNEILLPWGSINFSKQYRRILGLNPQLGLEQNSIKRYQDNIIVTKGVDNQTIDGIVIIDEDSSGDQRVILADTAKLLSNTEKNGVISIELQQVNSISTTEKPREYNYLIADKMIYNILIKDLTLEVQNLTADQQSSRDLYNSLKRDYIELVQPKEISRANIIADMTDKINFEYKELTNTLLISDSQSNKELIKNNSMINYYTRYINQRKDVYFNRSFRVSEIVWNRKIAFPFAILLFVIIAFPMGSFYKRSGRTVGFGIGLILSFLYWVLIIINQSIGVNSPNISPFWIMWYPNFVMLIVGTLVLYFKRN